MTIRELHTDVDLRTMYAQSQPEGIGRDAFLPWACGRIFVYGLSKTHIAQRGSLKITVTSTYWQPNGLQVSTSYG